MVYRKSVTVYLGGDGCFYYIYDSDPRASRRASGSLSSEDSGSYGDSDLYCGKYRSNPVYSFVYQKDI